MLSFARTVWGLSEPLHATPAPTRSGTVHVASEQYNRSTAHAAQASLRQAVGQPHASFGTQASSVLIWDAGLWLAKSAPDEAPARRS